MLGRWDRGSRRKAHRENNNTQIDLHTLYRYEATKRISGLRSIGRLQRDRRPEYLENVAQVSFLGTAAVMLGEKSIVIESCQVTLI